MELPFVSTFFCVLGVVGLVWLFAVEFRGYRVKVFRQHLFGTRDALFEAARKGEIGFDAMAYKRTRQQINSLIRHAEELSIARVILWWIFDCLKRRVIVTPHEMRARSDCAAIMASLSDEQRTLIQSLSVAVNVAILSHLLHISFVFAPLMFVLKAVTPVRGPSTLREQILQDIRKRIAHKPAYVPLGSLEAADTVATALAAA